MRRKPSAARTAKVPIAPLAAPEPAAQDSDIVARPDGHHWIAPDGKQDFGPFETLERARAYRDVAEEPKAPPADAIQEVEAEIGIVDWIDPDTGEPAEGRCPPHLERE